MKKMFATLAVVGLLALSAAPAFAVFYDRAPVKEWCIVGFGPSGYTLELRTTSCVPFTGASCGPQACLRPNFPVQD